MSAMSTFDEELARCKRSFEIEAENNAARAHFSSLLRRRGHEFEAQRVQDGFWFEDRAQAQWQARIGAWKKIKTVPGLQSSQLIHGLLSDDNRYFSWIMGDSISTNNRVSVVDLDAEKILASRRIAADNTSLIAKGSQFLACAHQAKAYSWSASEPDHWVYEADFRWPSVVCRGAHNYLIHSSGQLWTWPELKLILLDNREHVHLLAFNQADRRFLVRRGRRGSVDLKNHSGEILHSFKIGHSPLWQRQQSFDFIAAQQESWFHYQICSEYKIQKTHIDFESRRITNVHFSRSGAAFRCFFDRVPRRFEITLNQFCRRERYGIGMQHRWAREDQCWHPLADVAAVLRPPDFKYLALRSTDGHNVLRCGPIEFLSFSSDGTRMAVARQVGSAMRIEIWG
jgi:hypothetical protein